MNEDYTEILNLYRGFIGKEHFTALVRLLGYSGIALTISGCILPNTKTHLKNTILPYYKNLKARITLAYLINKGVLESSSRNNQTSKS